MLYKCNKSSILLLCSQEVAQSVICYWRKDELRKDLKGLKKKVDDMDKARKAAVMAQVVEETKHMIESSPNQKYVVHQFHAGSNAKVGTK